MYLAANFASIIAPYSEGAIKIRCMRSLVTQIKKDHADIGRLWKKYGKDQITLSDIDQFLEKIAWLRKSLSRFQRLRNDGIEGFIWCGTEQIEIDVQSNMEKIGTISAIVFGETGKAESSSHLDKTRP